MDQWKTLAGWEIFFFFFQVPPEIIMLWKLHIIYVNELSFFCYIIIYLKYYQNLIVEIDETTQFYENKKLIEKYVKEHIKIVATLMGFFFFFFFFFLKVHSETDINILTKRSHMKHWVVMFLTFSILFLFFIHSLVKHFHSHMTVRKYWQCYCFPDWHVVLFHGKKSLFSPFEVSQQMCQFVYLRGQHCIWVAHASLTNCHTFGKQTVSSKGREFSKARDIL